MLDLSRLYSRQFYKVTSEGSLRAAECVLERLWHYSRFDNVIDVGCGVGAWLATARKLGATSIIGVEGQHIPEDLLLVPPECMLIRDLSEALILTERYDLCLCLEVAEHLLPERAETLVDDLIGLSSVVAFSAAIPYQGGDGHFNEMWPEAWARLFARYGYVPWTGLRESIWNRQDIPWWYRQNLIVYVRRSEWHRILGNEGSADERRLTLIHPESYLWNVRREKGNLFTSYDYDLNVYYSSPCGGPLKTSYGGEFPAPRPDSI